MSLKVGQFTKEQLPNLEDYSENVASSIVNITYTRSRVKGYLTVTDSGFALPEGKKFVGGVTYYVKMNCNGGFSGDVTFMLTNEVEDSETYMPIKRMIISHGANQGIVLIFTPDRDYNYLVCHRNEHLEENVLCSFENVEIKKLKNLIDTYFSNHYNLSYLKNIGIQGAPGLRFVLNGEGFTLNYSGMFVLNSVNVTQISFVVTEQTESFLLDFQY